tara:strand:+ start:337 stop:516 length:180 start_codon:yes stop_codon:yes gene_type:complete
MEKITIIDKAEKLRMIRWLNLVVGIWQLYYYVGGAGLFTGIIACLNIAVFVFTRQMQVK